MLKKVTMLAGALMLLLASAQLALAQQNADETQSVKSTFEATGGTQTTGDTQTTGGGQAAPPDPGQQDTGQTQPTGETQPALPGLDSFIHLNANGNLVIDCQAASDMLAQLNQRGETEANDQSELIVVQMLAQLCADSGFTPSGAEQPSDSTSSGGQQA